MGLQRRLVFSVLAVCFLLGVYFGIILQRMISGSLNPKKPLDGKNSSDRGSHVVPTFHPELSSGAVLQQQTRSTKLPTLKTHTSAAATLQKTAQTVAPSGLKSTSRSDAVGKTRTSTKGPLLQHKQVGTTEPPYIGDAYMSEDVPPQTDCPDGIRRKVSKTQFGGRFLKDIPVLQWAKYVSREEHQRLRKYPGAHGWGGIDYDTLVETLSVLNISANRQMLDDWKQHGDKLKCICCAVVGNGGILKDSKKGKEIDSHHYIFRTNGAIIKGFEQDVGSRTTHYTFSTNTLMNSLRSYAQFGYKGPPVSNETRYIFLPDHDRDYLLMKAAATHTLVERGHEHGKDPTMFFGKDVSKEKLKMYHPDFIRYLRNRFLRSSALKTKYKDIYRPSTGAVMLLAALHTCDQVSAYGFMTTDYKNYSDHYYDSRYHPVAFFINHDLRMEMELWQQLHQEGLIQLYMRN